MKKGYHIYFLDTHCYVTSITVTFHEESFFSLTLTSPRSVVSSPPYFPPLVVIVDPFATFPICPVSSMSTPPHAP